jgi:hypothetical protein
MSGTNKLLSIVLAAAAFDREFDNGKSTLSSASATAEATRSYVERECATAFTTKQALSPMQQFYVELTDLVNNIRDQLRVDIKAEIRMEMHLELEDLRAQIAALKVVPSEQSRPKFSGFNNDKISANDKINDKINEKPTNATPLSNAPSLSLKSRARSSVKVTQPVDSHETTEENTKESTKEKDALAALASNPIFARVSQNLERSKTGKQENIEDFINARGTRIGKNEAETIRATALKFDMQTGSDDEEDARWSKMLADKYSAEL